MPAIRRRGKIGGSRSSILANSLPLLDLVRPSVALLKPTNIPAFIALIVMLVAAWYAAGQNQVPYEQRLRSDVLKVLSL